MTGRSRFMAWLPSVQLATPSWALTCTLVASSLVVTSGCAEPALSSHEHVGELREALEPYGLEVEVAPTSVGLLRWQPPESDCLQVYRIETQYDPDLQFEADSSSVLAFGPDERTSDPDDDVFAARIFYQGVRAEKRGVTRDAHLSPTFAGPAAPTVACTPKTWDPVEDALALAWPRLTDRLTAVGEHWNGLRVEGKCNRTACIDPKTGGGGPEMHDVACVTPAWREELAGIYDIGSQRYALMVATWTDGHAEVGRQGVQPGIWAERWALVSLEHGRPAWVRATIRHGFPAPTADQGFAPVTRTWEAHAIDACPGSLADAGWERPGALTRILEDARAGFGEDGARTESIGPSEP